MPRLPIIVASLFLPMTLLSAQTPTRQYSYDAVGNMTSALPDGIQSISYNELNLPETVVLSSGSTRRIEQLYSADGEKLGRDCYDQSGARVSHRTYVGPLVLEDGVPVMLLVDGGYISIGTQNGEYSGDYHFFVGDHQGNVRAVVGEDGTIEQTVHYDPFGEMAVDNLSPNRYLYSGKEWDLNQQSYDFGARMYMPAYSRFTTIDPLCEQDFTTSHTFCRNNPVNLVDPDGRVIIPKGSDELTVIKNTLPRDARNFVELDWRGMINQSVLASYPGKSENVKSLLQLAEDELVITFELSDAYVYKGREGRIGSKSLSYFPPDPFLSDPHFEATSGLVSGEGGNYAKTLFPDTTGLESSSTSNIEIVVTPSLSPLGRAEAFSHEAYGHALLYILNGHDHHGASHHALFMEEQNTTLKNMILDARKETFINISK